ncbi:hypothetical protein PR048_029867 [Dryococelus australis]|uniref:Uncharacterized protein n=1 Tax=Dryococelus australis TaxID=614101 RepID=A0ABQ9GBA8_9NEOP|nr:hypothetical protein PR048_029867 [Dryococelus australis]
MENARSTLMATSKTLRFLYRQGLSIQGHEDVSSNFIQLLELRKEDMPNLREWMGRSSYKWLAELFETYSEEYSSDAASKCAGYLGTTQHFRTFFFLNLYCHVMSPVEEVNVKIQCPHIGVTEVESKLSYLIYILEEKHGGSEQFWQKCLEEKPTHVEEPQLSRRRRIP